MARVSRFTRSTLLLGVGLLAFIATEVAAQDTAMNTRRIGSISLPGSSGTKGLWSYETDGSYYCLQTRGSAGMAIIDMTDISNPTVVKNVSGNFRKVQVYENYAYATTDSGPTVVIDLSTPSRASVVGSMPTGAHTLRIDQSNGRLYLNRSSSLYIYDLTGDPTSPQLLGTKSIGAHDCRPAGDIVYVNGFQTNPTRILRVADPANPVQLGTLPNGNHASALYIAPNGDRILITCDEQTGGHVNLFDVNDPMNPQQISSYQTDDLTTSVHNVEVRGAYAYIAYYQDQLRILDLRDPSNPVEVGVWDNNRLNTGSTYSDAWEAIPTHDAVYMNQMNDTPAGPKGTFAIDFYPGFGTGSDGKGSVGPQAWWSFGPPSPGNTRFALRLTDALPNTPAWLIIGSSNTTWGANALPMTMDIVGAPNASLYTSVDILIQTTTDAQGNASVSLPIPASVPYTTFYAQWAVKDSGAPNPGGWAFTKGGELVIY